MKKAFFIICCLLTTAGIVCANDSISTRYVKGEFISYCSIDAAAPKAVGDSIVEDLVDQITSDYEQLFSWAFKGLGQQGEDDVRDEVVVLVKESHFDRLSGICNMVVDIEVPHVTSFRDVPVDSKVLISNPNDATTRVDVDIYYSNAVLKKAYGIFFVKAIDEDHIEMSVEVHVRFGWFFNIFITQRRFRNIFEWREQGFMNNLKEEALRRKSNGNR